MTTPAVQKALDHLLPLCRPRKGLPRRVTISALARAAGVSLVTMWKAVNILKAQGLLSSYSRRGTFLGKEPTRPRSSSPGPKTTGPRIWQQVHDQVRRELLRGDLAPGQPLPSSKELCRRYRCSLPTLRKALKLLMEEELIASTAHGYSAPAFKTAHAARITLILDTSYPDQTDLENERQRELFRALELSCRRAGTSIDTIRFPRSTGSFPATFSLDSSDSSLGCLVWCYYNTEIVQESLKTVLSLRKPVSIIDEIGIGALPASLPSRRELSLFPVGVSTAPGVEAARYLLSLGHRTVAYVSPYHGAQWSRQRLAGLEKIYYEAGGAVRTAVIDNLSSHVQYYSASAERFRTDRLIDSFTAWAAPLRTELGDRFEPLTVRYLREETAYSEVSVHLQTRLEAILGDRKITAWVAAEDRTAMLIAQLLTRAGVRVGTDASVLGFDDSPFASENRLTSYNLSMASIADAAIRHIVNPVAFRKLAREERVEIPGIFVERGSTGPVRE